jgi:hypothetical protein
MPVEREAREPVPRAREDYCSMSWIPDISLAAKFRDDNAQINHAVA